MERIVVVGGGYAGLLAAQRLDKRLRGRASVTLVSATAAFVERIRLHEAAAGGRASVRPIARFLDGTGVALRIARVVAIDRARREVACEDGTRLGYDWLLLALGSAVDGDAIPGARAHALPLDPGAGAVEELRAWVTSPSRGRASAGAEDAPRRLLVVGGGLSAIEASAELGERAPSLRVTLVTAGPLGHGLVTPPAEAHVRASLDRLGVEVVEHAPVASIAADRALLVDGRTLPFDRCLLATGFRVDALLARAGLATNARGQAEVDACLRSISDERVFVAGDAACLVEPVGAPIEMSCRTGMPMGAHAADNLAALVDGGRPRPFRFGDSGLCVSLGRHDGVVQRRRRDGSFDERVYTGRLAAWMKEQVCRYTLWMLRLERRPLGGYRWLGPPAALVSLRADDSPSLPSRASVGRE